MDNVIPVQDRFFQAGGTLAPDMPSYVTREADDELFGLALSGEYCNVLTARQTGKSSLMVRTNERLHRAGVHTATLDLTKISGQGMAADAWYYSLVREICVALNLQVDTRQWWQERERYGSVQRFTDFLQQVALKQIKGRIVILIDEIDSTLPMPFTDDFFAAIRALYNKRASDPDSRRC